MAKQRPVLFLRSVITIFLLIGLIVYLIIKSEKPKESFTKVEGQIVYIDETYNDLPNRHFGKYRYILIDSYYRPFEIFVGKETGDFSPEFEKIDVLKKGDIITIYYDDRPEKTEEQVNRYTYFIDRNNEFIYKNGNANRTAYLIFIGAGISFILILFYLKKKGKII